MEQMTKEEYIEKLKANLDGLNKEDLDDAINYVEEYFSEAGDENIEKVIEELGSPHRFAATIRADSTIKNTSSKLDDIKTEQKRSSNNIRALWIIILGIFALPIAFPILISTIVVVFSIFLSIFILIIAGIISAVAFTFISIPSLISATALLETNFNSGIFALGLSFLSLGIGLLFMTMLISCFRSFIPWTIKKMGNLFQKLKGDKKHA